MENTIRSILLDPINWADQYGHTSTVGSLVVRVPLLAIAVYRVAAFALSELFVHVEWAVKKLSGRKIALPKYYPLDMRWKRTGLSPPDEQLTSFLPSLIGSILLIPRLFYTPKLFVLYQPKHELELQELATSVTLLMNGGDRYAGVISSMSADLHKMSVEDYFRKCRESFNGTEIATQGNTLFRFMADKGKIRKLLSEILGSEPDNQLAKVLQNELSGCNTPEKLEVQRQKIVRVFSFHEKLGEGAKQIAALDEKSPLFIAYYRLLSNSQELSSETFNLLKTQGEHLAKIAAEVHAKCEGDFTEFNGCVNALWDILGSEPTVEKIKPALTAVVAAARKLPKKPK